MSTAEPKPDGRAKDIQYIMQAIEASGVGITEGSSDALAESIVGQLIDDNYMPLETLPERVRSDGNLWQIAFEESGVLMSGSGDYVDVLFDGPPGPVAGRFVDTVDPDGRSVSGGEWIDRGDGYWALRMPLHAGDDTPTEAVPASYVAGVGKVIKAAGGGGSVHPSTVVAGGGGPGKLSFVVGGGSSVTIGGGSGGGSGGVHCLPFSITDYAGNVLRTEPADDEQYDAELNTALSPEPQELPMDTGNIFSDAKDVSQLMYLVVGAASMAWVGVKDAGEFRTDWARLVAEDGLKRLGELDDK